MLLHSRRKLIQSSHWFIKISLDIIINLKFLIKAFERFQKKNFFVMDVSGEMFTFVEWYKIQAKVLQISKSLFEKNPFWRILKLSFGDLIIVKTWVYDKILQFLVHEKFVTPFHHLLQETKQGNFSEHNCGRHWCDYLRHGRSSLMTSHNVLSGRNRMYVIELIRMLNSTLISLQKPTSLICQFMKNS